MTGYLYQGSPLLGRLNAQVRAWRVACHGDEGPHGRGLCTDGRWSRSKVGRLNAVDVLGRPIARGEGIGRPR